MENRNTLRSQTVRCTHCGEYYSVTYDYCPFCDAGRKEADKKKTGSIFNTLFGMPEEEKNLERSRRESSGKRPPRRDEGRPASERRASGRVERMSSAQEDREERPARRREPREERSRESREERSRSREDREKRRERRAPQRREVPADDDLPRMRKKTSEMTESERAANRAEREARAAQRKRERERAAAEAEARARAKQAEQAILAQQQQAAGGETVGPVFETMMPPESFGFETDASGSALPRETGDFSTTQTGMTFRTFTIPLKGATGPIPGVTEPEEAPQPEAEGPEPAADKPAKPAKGKGTKEHKESKEPEGVLSEEEASSWAALRSLEDTGGTEVEVTDDTSALVPTGREQTPEPVQEPAPKAQEAPPPQAEQPQAAQAPETKTQPAAPPAPPQDSKRNTDKVIPIQSRVQDTKPIPAAPPAEPVQNSQPAAQAQAETAVQAAAPETVQTAAQTPEEAPSDPEQDLDALLNEIREMIANSPVPVLEEEEPPAPSVEESLEPTIIRSVYPPAQAETDGGKEAAQPEQAEQQAPPAETAETPAAPEELPDEDEDELEERDTAISFAFWQKKKAQEAQEAMEAEETADGEETAKKKRSPIPMILSLVLIAAALFIVATRFVPALQTGMVGQLIGRIGQSQVSDDTAQTFTLSKKDLLFTEPGKTETLVPVFAPEGTTAVLGWSSSDAQVASVDENGVVTTVGPGTATITATMSSGESAQCIIRCNWNGGDQPAEGDTPEGEGAEQSAQGGPGGVSLSAEQLTIDAPGDSKQLTLNGAAGEVKWSSNSNTIATVSSEGLVSAVGIGVATITAAYDGQEYTCKVRCIW